MYSSLLFVDICLLLTYAFYHSSRVVFASSGSIFLLIRRLLWWFPILSRLPGESQQWKEVWSLWEKACPKELIQRHGSACCGKQGWAYNLWIHPRKGLKAKAGATFNMWIPFPVSDGFQWREHIIYVHSCSQLKWRVLGRAYRWLWWVLPCSAWHDDPVIPTALWKGSVQWGAEAHGGHWGSGLWRWLWWVLTSHQPGVMTHTFIEHYEKEACKKNFATKRKAEMTEAAPNINDAYLL